MTRDKILAMKPGKALDELIATEVMLWVKGSESGWGFYWYKDKSRKSSLGCVKDWKFQPSKDIVAAWQVVEKLRTDGILLRMLSNRKGKYFCSFGGEYLAHATAEAETAPEAIVKASLLAVLENK